MAIEPFTSIWQLRDALNGPNFMRMKDGQPQAKLYVLVASDGHEIAEVWVNVADNTAEHLERVRRDGVLMQYSPMLFWAMNQLHAAEQFPEGMKELTGMVLQAIESYRAGSKGRPEGGTA